MREDLPDTRGARRRRRGPSRQVRLRRTIAVTVLLVLVAVVTVRLTRGGDTPLVDAASSGSRPTTSAPSSSSTSKTPNNEDGSSTTETSTSTTKVPQNGNGKITVVSVPGADVPSAGRTVKYTVEIEGGLGVDPAEVGATVEGILLDPRGWQKVDGVRFVNVSPAQEATGAHVDVRVTLASPGLTDKLCAPMRTLSQVSCWNGERSVLNFRRWAQGDDSYGDDVARYRVYQVNHEVGHGIGHQHKMCPGKGERAPVMVQQTLDLGGCKPWPYPSGA
ncbi:Protein of unknown function [Pedococcus dokdonensis]|uniref:DUF3152 domain-containing protein n=1 Tax=Pedococcus dokdonensis TaxID=443156 RepID=A0A1H0LXU8_9MICO|nr:DUF3152 domain-containing protein [Pedococcus dokdonensis]SDO72977.1 Protein of unknown function [Pedococcus dokdonensis]